MGTLVLSVRAGIRGDRMGWDMCWRSVVSAKNRRKKDRRSLMEKRNHHNLSTETQHLSSAPVGLFFNLDLFLTIGSNPKYFIREFKTCSWVSNLSVAIN